MDVPCVLVTARTAIPDDVIAAADAADLPVMRTSVPTAAAIGKLTALLEDRLAVREMIHGVLLDILGLGVLLAGDSGIGKSECALDLVGRGHRLVADDTVEIRRRAESIVLGTCPELHPPPHGGPRPRSHQRARPVRRRSDPDVEAHRVGRAARALGPRRTSTIGWDWTSSITSCSASGSRSIRMPVAPGRNLGTLVEVAARNQLLRARGINAARELVARLDASLLDPHGTEEHDREDEDGDAGDMP